MVQHLCHEQLLRRRVDRYLEPSRAKGVQAKGSSSSNRSIIGLAAESYLEERRSGRTNKTINKTFREFAKTQIRTFLFAGHDSTSSAMCSVYYLISQNPSTVEKLRAEHDAVFGEDHSKAASILSEQPQSINQVPYTTAVIKEALRLFPPTSSMREGSPDYFIVGSDGTKYRTDGTMIWVIHQSLHRNPAYWNRPDDFVPERWLVGPDDPLHPIKDAWRPFEFGPRNCLGQELAMQEVKAVLILTCREYDILPAYDEWDLRHPRTGPKTVKGDRMYQVERIGAHPVDGFPCKVRLRE